MTDNIMKFNLNKQTIFVFDPKTKRQHIQICDSCGEHNIQIPIAQTLSAFNLFGIAQKIRTSDFNAKVTLLSKSELEKGKYFWYDEICIVTNSLYLTIEYFCDVLKPDIKSISEIYSNMSFQVSNRGSENIVVNIQNIDSNKFEELSYKFITNTYT